MCVSAWISLLERHLSLDLETDANDLRLTNAICKAPIPREVHVHRYLGLELDCDLLGVFKPQASKPHIPGNSQGEWVVLMSNVAPPTAASPC